MNLLVDIGNYRLKWAVGDTVESWNETGNVPLAPALAENIGREWGRLAAPMRVVVSNVAGSKIQILVENWIMRHWFLKPVFIQAQKELLGIRNGYSVPAELGSDRWAAMIGAWQLAPRAFCIVDCGTAVTVDAVSEDGEFVGGAIFPGLMMTRNALQQETHGIRTAAGSKVPLLRCRSTADGVYAGTLFGLAGAVDRMLEEYLAMVGENAAVYLTGGDAPVVAPRLHHAVTHVSDLVFRGLGVIAGQLE